MERSIGLAFTTLLVVLAPLAHAAHPKQAVKPEGTASPFEFVVPAMRPAILPGVPRSPARCYRRRPPHQRQRAHRPDCSVIEGSIAFVFTDVLPDDPRTVCEVIAQEIAHSFGLDHEMLASDPMTYLDYDGDRRFQNRMVSCGEYAGRTCGVNGSTCRQRQNSVALLTERLGARGGGGADQDPAGSAGSRDNLGGCTAAGGLPSGAMALALLGVRRRRRRR